MKDKLKCPHCEKAPECELWGSTAMYCCKHCGFLGNRKLWQAAVDVVDAVESEQQALWNLTQAKGGLETLREILRKASKDSSTVKYVQNCLNLINKTLESINE